MVIEAFISVLFNQLNHVMDEQMVDEQKEEFVISTVKEALLGCRVDWATRNDFTTMAEMDNKLDRYAGLLNVVAVKFHAADMLDLPLFERICEYARKMKKVADKPKNKTPECSAAYEKATCNIFADMDKMYEDFSRLYRTF
ncbi:hypothetical protein [Methanosarcina barkeri]|uniref:hypothetical protein n=1 Tax=Methanosarcina barkeri TaxID=2208 RepID=UPI00064FC7A7|nr:hypothetical protein [Methanosarcina barkeri]